MADDLADNRQWRDSVEGRLGKLEATVDEQARLRAAMDSDMGDMKAELGVHRRLIQAIRDTQSDHTKRLTRLESKVDTLDSKVDTLDSKVDTLDSKVDTLDSKVDSLEAKVNLVSVGVDAIRSLLERNQGSTD